MKKMKAQKLAPFALMNIKKGRRLGNSTALIFTIRSVLSSGYKMIKNVLFVKVK